jgi:hypothetical protein
VSGDDARDELRAGWREVKPCGEDVRDVLEVERKHFALAGLVRLS